METAKYNLKTTLKGYLQTLRHTRYLRYRLMGYSSYDRTQDFAKKDYGPKWGSDIKSLRDYSPRIAVIRNRFAETSLLQLDVEFLQAHFDRLKKFIDIKDQGQVLEVGAGYGRTILPLSSLFPNAEFSGIEYCEEGAEAIKAFEKYYLSDIRDVANSVATFYPKNPIVKDYRVGDGKNLPYTDGAFDVSYTNLVIEQIPKEEDHLKVFKEMRRVTKKACLFLEPWGDAQNPLTMAYLKHVDYFRGSYRLLEKAGFRKVSFEPLDFHHNLKFKLGYVVAEV